MTANDIHHKSDKSLDKVKGGAQFNNVIDQMMDGAIIVDNNGILHTQNPAAVAILENLPEVSFFGKDFLWKAKAGKTVELTHTKPDGSLHVVEMRISAINWEGKSAYLAILRDISEEKEKQRSLQSDLDHAEARAAELEVMRFVADQLNQAALVEETIQSGLEMIQALTNAIAVWALLVDKMGKTQLVVIDNQLNGMKAERGMINLPTNCTCLQKFLDGKVDGPIYVQNCEWMPFIYTAIKEPFRHISIVLKAGDHNLGLLNLACGPEDRMCEKDLGLVRQLAGQLAQAIERARVFSDNRQALRRSEVLNSASRTINSALDLSVVLQNVMRLASELSGADAGSLGLLSQDEQHLNFPFVIGLPPEVSQPMERTSNLFWEVVDNGKSMLTNDFGEPTGNLLSYIIPGLRSLMMVPILGHEKCLGVISLYNMNPERQFSDFDLSLIESLGRQAGLAIQNAELFFEIQQLTTTDTLTGLHNNPSFTNLAMKEVERAWRYGRPLSIVMVDLDNLGKINDKFGKEGGDMALQALAKCCLQSLRRVDILGRFENAEILLLLPETDLLRAYDVAERLRQHIESTTLQTEKGEIPLTASLGISGIETKGEIDLQTLLERAESALYDAKNLGRNRVLVWKSEG
jgi:diguanylate cyclase (GGDEF)-like protein